VKPVRPRLGISSCLLGEPVRYDGSHKRDRWISATLANYVDFVPLCPEMAIGLGAPRPPIRIFGDLGNERVIGADDPKLDVTEALETHARIMAGKLPDISGYIFKHGSPSCGMAKVRRYPTNHAPPNRDAQGRYAGVLMEALPLLPTEEEGRLNDPALRDNFIERVFTYQRWQQLIRGGITPRGLVDFHTQHKYLIMAHGVAPYRVLGRLVSQAGATPLTETATSYITRLMPALKKPASRKGHANVLEHLQGFLKKNINRADKQEMAELIQRYRRGQVPLVVPLTLLKHHLRKHPHDWVANQVYLEPHPSEMMLRNRV